MPAMTQIRQDAILGGSVITLKATDLAVGLLIWYDGPLTYATIQVNAGGDILGLADDTDTTPVLAAVFKEVGGSAGTIDVSDANGNTFGEVEDAINHFEAAGWHAKLQGVLRSTSSNDALLVVGVTDCHKDRVPGGLALVLDSDTAKVHGIRITGDTVSETNRGVVNLISRIVVTPTGTGALQMVVYNISGTTETAIYTPAAESTGVESVHNAADWGDKPIRSIPGDDLLVHLTAATSLSACTMTVSSTSVGQAMRQKLRSLRQ